jgi:hypothetical protein
LSTDFIKKLKKVRKALPHPAFFRKAGKSAEAKAPALRNKQGS